MGKNVLLVEPDYWTNFPPLGLLKLATYHRGRNNNLTLVRGRTLVEQPPDLVYVTSLFTYSWRPVHETVQYYKAFYPNAEVWLGGLYASLMPEHAQTSGADHIHVGLFKEAEGMMPAYDLVDPFGWDGSILFTSRGCIHRCPYCAVPALEGRPSLIKYSIKELIYPKHTRVILWDNNLLGSPNCKEVLDELYEIGLKVDFNQGLDARLMNTVAAEKIARLKTDTIRLAYDYRSMWGAVRTAVRRLVEAGVSARKIVVYTLYNYTDDPYDLLVRVRELLHLGVASYPMRYEPVYSLEKNKYVAPKWDRERLNTVTRARRVIGYGGAFPPYEGLINKFDKASDFDEAFGLYPIETSLGRRKNPNSKRRVSRWAGGLDWRNRTKK